MERQGRVDPLLVFGQRILAARRKQGWSQDQLARQAHLHRTYISSVERGRRNVSLTNILGLASALKVDPGDLIRGLEPPPRVLPSVLDTDDYWPARGDEAQPPDEPGT